MGYRGLALGTAVAANVNAGLLLYRLRGRLGGIDGRRISVVLAKIVVASAAMGAAAYFTHAALAGVLRPSLLGRTLAVGGGIAVGLAALSIAARILRIEEFGAALRRVLARPRGPELDGDAG
jgi:putative peptidoglycan lipid II flippase